METGDRSAVRQEHQKQVNVGGAERKASMASGAVLTLSGIKRLTKGRFLSGLAMIATGGIVFYRGKTGHCNLYQAMGVSTAGPEQAGIEMEKAITIHLPPQQVYEFWRNLANLPRFMRHLESVRVTGDRSSHWKVVGTAGVTIEWDAEIVDDQPGRRISWRSTGEADIPNEGEVDFIEASGGRDTDLKVIIRYHPPGGAAGKAAAKALRFIGTQQIEEDLQRLKQILEAGEAVTAGAP